MLSWVYRGFMTKKIDFQFRVLRKYGVIPIFDGEPEFEIVRTSIPNETFKKWCRRVIGKSNNEVAVYKSYQPKGNERIGGLGQGGDQLRKLVETQSRKSFMKGVRRNCAEKPSVVDDFILEEARLISKNEIYETLADSAPDRSESIDQFFKKFAEDHAGSNGWADVFEGLASDYVKLAKMIKPSGEDF